MKNELLQHIRTTKTNLHRPMLESPKVVMGGPDTGVPSYAIAEGYQSEIRVRVDFFCENVESNVFELARENAAKQLLDFIYGPCVRKLNELRASLYGGDRVGCMKIISELEQYMTKVE